LVYAATENRGRDASLGRSFLLIGFVSSGKVARIPSREEMQPIVNEQLIVELYSR
jgi:ribosomal protein S4